MSRGPHHWMGWVDPAASATSDPFPNMLKGSHPAFCTSVDDLPPATGGIPPNPHPDSSHEWNVARFRPVLMCTTDGTVGTAYVLMTSISVSGG